MAQAKTDSNSSSSDPKPINQPALALPNASMVEKFGHDGHPVEIEEELRFAGRRVLRNEDDDEEDMDALVEELESVDPDAESEDEIKELYLKNYSKQTPELG